jgi:hypothetical protein
MALARLAALLVLLAIPALAVGAQTWDAASGPNLVTNPSFEEVREGGIVGWDGAAAVYGSDATTAASGVRSLRFVNHDPASYLLCTQPITLQPGFMYEVKALVRTQGLTGDDSGAAVCVEWSDSQGREAATQQVEEETPPSGRRCAAWSGPSPRRQCASRSRATCGRG